MLTLAALLTKGSPLPFTEPEQPPEPVNVIYQTTEDDADDTMKDFFNGNPTTSEDYNKSVAAGSAKPGAVRARQQTMQSLVDSSDNDSSEILMF